MWVSIQKGTWFCHWPGWTPHHTERTDQNSPILLPGPSQCTPCPSSQFPNRILCIHESTVLPYHPTVIKACRKIPRPLQGHCTSGVTLIYTIAYQTACGQSTPSSTCQCSNPHTATSFWTAPSHPHPWLKLMVSWIQYEISKILDSKINKCQKHCNIVYLVWWTGYKGTDEETSWILANELGHASKIIADFHKAYPGKPRPWTS